MYSLIETNAPTARGLFKLKNNWFVVRSPAGEFSLLANTHTKPKLPQGYVSRGPFKSRETAIAKALLWKLECQEAA
jgi:hypothetical protein